MNNLELVRFAKSKLGTPYVYGMKGAVLTEKQYDRLKILFGDLVWDSDRKKIGQVCVDCSGLISWATGIHRNSRGYHDTAEVIFPISTVKEAPVETPEEAPAQESGELTENTENGDKNE